MKPLRFRCAAVVAFVLLTVTDLAADISGHWKWTLQNRNGPQEVNATFVVKDGTLTGTVSGRMGDAPIGDGLIEDAHVAFTITRDIGGEKIVIKYSGQIAGDTINGTVERPGRDGDAALIQEWKATKAP